MNVEADILHSYRTVAVVGLTSRLGRPSHEVVDIFRRPRDVPRIVAEAIAVGARVVWMQQGIVHEATARRAREAGLEVVMDRCMMVEHRRLARRHSRE